MSDVALPAPRPGHHDPALRARIVERIALHFDVAPAQQPAPPPHVRAASSLALFDERLAVIQDDASWLALIAPPRRAGSGATPVAAWPLPADALGRRVHDKRTKLDLEACAALPLEQGGELALLAFGSGSSEARERIAVVRADRSVVLLDGARFFAQLRETTGFSGSELNLEGVVFEPPDTVRLIQRGNGAPRGGLEPVDATAALSWRALWRHLSDPAAPLDPLLEVTRYALGDLDGVRLTLTDGALAPHGALALLAAAEDSPDTWHDGRVAGSAVAVAGAGDAHVRWAPLETADGTLAPLKAEGLCLDPDDPTRAWVVHDPDDPLRAAELLVVALDGPWWSPAR